MVIRGQSLRHGFTIVELLIVIVVIGLLASITVVAYNGIQVRARDSKRAQDFATIQKMLRTYEAKNGGVPHVSTYGGSGGGGWNTSTMGSWITPLSSEGTVPRDPLNNFSGDPGDVGNGAGTGYGYFYYCYDQNPDYARLGYFKEQNSRERIAIVFDTTCIMS